MTRYRLLFAAAIVWVLAARPAYPQDRKPGDMYLELVSASKKATAFEQIAPYLSSAFLKDMKAQPKAQRDEWFKYFKDTVNLTDIKFTKEKISGDGCVLEATAKTAGGKTSTGKIELVREKGAWKFSDHGWATEH
jgi:hypothetical protein